MDKIRERRHAVLFNIVVLLPEFDLRESLAHIYYYTFDETLVLLVANFAVLTAYFVPPLALSFFLFVDRLHRIRHKAHVLKNIKNKQKTQLNTFSYKNLVKKIYCYLFKYRTKMFYSLFLREITKLPSDAL